MPEQPAKTAAGAGFERASDRVQQGGRQGETSSGNVVLIGMPGAGKSTLGVVLAKIMGKDFVDADLVIQSRCGAPLARIIEERGIDGFLALENEVLSTLDVADTVVSTGGSAVYSEEAMRVLSGGGTMVYLRVSVDELDARLGDLTQRGVVMRDGMTDNLRALADERIPLYERHADVVFDCEGPSIRALACDLAHLLAGR